ncbi:MAG: ABC transporter ATP-binding protein [Opitutaceae bacterium]
MPQTHQTDAPLLSVTGLRVRRDEAEIIKGIDWKVLKGENWAILGANGCGKTTLLAAITAYLTPTGGKLELLGESYGEAEWNEVRKRIGIVSTVFARRVPDDEPALITVLSGATAQLGFWTRERKVDTRKALRCLSAMKVRALAERPWGVLSQGERQKVFIARALMADPELLILDEPCAGLDPVAREHFIGSLRKLAQSKNAPGLILVTHHIEEIFAEISHVLLLKKGKVLASGCKHEVLNSKNLSQAFGAPVKARKRPNDLGWSLQVGD